MEDVQNHLKPIIIQRRRFHQADQSLYRVYSAPGEFQLVEAGTAHEAFEKSGISRPYKIERETLIRQNAIAAQHLSSETDGEVAFDPRLPDPEDLKPILTAILGDALHEAAMTPFESISIVDLKKPSPESKKVSAELAAQMEEPLAQVEAPKEAEPVPQPKPEVALTPEQVDALLRGDEA